jgi:hypothetical protein
MHMEFSGHQRDLRFAGQNFDASLASVCYRLPNRTLRKIFLLLVHQTRDFFECGWVRGSRGKVCETAATWTPPSFPSPAWSKQEIGGNNAPRSRGPEDIIYQRI